MKHLNHLFQNFKPFRNPFNHYQEIATRTWPKMNTFMRFAAGRKEAMASLLVENLKVIDGNIVGGNVEVASSSSFRDFPKRLFRGCEVGDGSGGVNTICRRPEVDDDVISVEDAETFQEYICILFVHCKLDCRSIWAQFSGPRSTNI